MSLLSNNRGQGSDTFKLLIAAVVAMVILGIVTGVFENIWRLLTQMPCADNVVNELVTKLQKAQSGLATATNAICMKAGEQLDASALTKKVTNVASVTFKCEGAAVCKNNDPIDVSSGDLISAKHDAKFTGLIDCEESPSGPGDYTCTITIRSG
jgi:hypothetical protein